MEGKEETAAEASYFSTVLIVAMRILYESISRSHQLEWAISFSASINSWKFSYDLGVELWDSIFGSGRRWCREEVDLAI